MNARKELLEIEVEPRAVEECTLALFHTLLWHRSTGKYQYQPEGAYVVGTLGMEDVDCVFVDFTYVRVNSIQLTRVVGDAVHAFADAMQVGTGQAPGGLNRPNGVALAGDISLEFYQRKRGRWPFPGECIPWEVWTLHVTLNADSTAAAGAHTAADETERERLANSLGDQVLRVVSVMNRHANYVPPAPRQQDLDLVFDMSYPDVQPYLFRIQHQTFQSSGPGRTGVAGAAAGAGTVGTTMKKFLKDTLAL